MVIYRLVEKYFCLNMSNRPNANIQKWTNLGRLIFGSVDYI